MHRDVKPQNVLLDGDGQAKVTDFGIARSLDVQHGMTQTGTVLGTSDYIAPEQAQGQRVDEHTDVYSLGVVLYELLTGEVPFPGENFVAVAMRHINEPPPAIRDRRPDVSPRLEAAVQKAMAKDARDRFPTHGRLPPGARGEPRRGAGRHAGDRACAPSRPPQARRLAVAAAARRRGADRDRRRDRRPGPAQRHRCLLDPSLVAEQPSGGARVSLSAVTAYDPFGQPPGQEHNAEAHYATDGIARTYWETERYHATFAEIGKQGVGLVLDAKSPVQLHQLGIATATPGFTAVIRAGDSPGAFPYTVSSSQVVSSGTQFTISGGRAPLLPDLDHEPAARQRIGPDQRGRGDRPRSGAASVVRIAPRRGRPAAARARRSRSRTPRTAGRTRSSR